MTGVNDRGNKFVAPSNQNLQIFIDPLPSHSTNVIETNYPSCSPNDVSLKTNNVVNLVDQQEPPRDFCIAFDPRETIKALDSPLYISAEIKGIPARGVPIDLACMVNVIT